MDANLERGFTGGKGDNGEWMNLKERKETKAIEATSRPLRSSLKTNACWPIGPCANSAARSALCSTNAPVFPPTRKPSSKKPGNRSASRASPTSSAIPTSSNSPASPNARNTSNPISKAPSSPIFRASCWNSVPASASRNLSRSYRSALWIKSGLNDNKLKRRSNQRMRGKKLFSQTSLTVRPSLQMKETTRI